LGTCETHFMCLNVLNSNIKRPLIDDAYYIGEQREYAHNTLNG